MLSSTLPLVPLSTCYMNRRESRSTDEHDSHMIDIINPSQADLDQARIDVTKHHTSYTGSSSANGQAQNHEEDSDDEEAAWLRDLEENDTDVAAPQRGNLVMDISLLRDTSHQNSSRIEAVR